MDFEDHEASCHGTDKYKSSIEQPEKPAQSVPLKEVKVRNKTTNATKRNNKLEPLIQNSKLPEINLRGIEEIKILPHEKK